ncbi:hypothetical protein YASMINEVIRUS_969 [Yasminevirus sp. GU-2018]|uniref:Uncharacterized protein n=1 Tax=Yasminevirus sp. GU-2018 TaxID=2420051 RepID=A0A5K0UBM3_9VIRU|nr:hypothetical protein YASMINEVIRUS_969 [Yasminevirus sp. GU-2018]
MISVRLIFILLVLALLVYLITILNTNTSDANNSNSDKCGAPSNSVEKFTSTQPHQSVPHPNMTKGGVNNVQGSDNIGTTSNTSNAGNPTGVNSNINTNVNNMMYGPKGVPIKSAKMLELEKALSTGLTNYYNNRPSDISSDVSSDDSSAESSAESSEESIEETIHDSRPEYNASVSDESSNDSHYDSHDDSSMESEDVNSMEFKIPVSKPIGIPLHPGSGPAVTPYRPGTDQKPTPISKPDQVQVPTRPVHQITPNVPSTQNKTDSKPDSGSAQGSNNEKCRPEEQPKCSASVCGSSNLHPILDPKFNMREASKQCLLLEDHLNNTKKRCFDCIRKHFLIVDGLLEEAVSLEKDNKTRDYYRGLYLDWVKIEKQYAKSPTASDNMDNVSKLIRVFRKPLVETYFDTVSDYED